jgi:hypothetical protein
LEYEPDMVGYKDKDGYLPSDYAKINNHAELVNILSSNRKCSY